MGYYEFFCPVNIVAGHHALERLPEVLADLRARKTLILTDQGVVGAGLIDLVTTTIKNHGVMWAIDADVPSDSDIQTVKRLAVVYRENAYRVLRHGLDADYLPTRAHRPAYGPGLEIPVPASPD